MQVFVAKIMHLKRLLLGGLAAGLLLPSPAWASKPGATGKPQSPTQSALGKPKFNLLTFPDRSVGMLQIYQFSPDSVDFDAHYLANARGKVAVPAELDCGLLVNYEGSQDLSFWNKLPSGSLVVLVANNLEISDEQLLALKHLDKLKVIEMSATEIGNRGFARFKECANLHELVTPSCLITGSALACLKDLTGLRRLVIDHNDLDDASIAHLKGLKNLLAVRLQACKIGDSGLAYLKDCQSLSNIDIGQNKNITDHCLPTLLTFKKLNRLNLTDTSVTMAGLKQLAKLPKLERLTLSYDRLTTKQLLEMRKLLPRCQIVNGRAGRVPLEIFDPITKKMR